MTLLARYRCRTIFPMAAVFLAGCGENLQYAPVSGTVTHRGSPIEGIEISFQPLDQPVAVQSVARTDASGRYTLKRMAVDNSGAMVGMHRVMMTSMAPNPNANESTPLPRELVPPRLRDGSVVFEVPTEGTDSADFAFEEYRQ